jgi:hypothetical protein
MKAPSSSEAPGRAFEPLDLSVLGAGGGQLWISAHSRQGEVHGVPRPVPSFEAATGGGDLPGWFGSAIREAQRRSEAALAVGHVLRDLVFGVPEIASLTEQTRGVAAGRGAQLLVRLLVAPSDIAAWPWELLVDPQHAGRFLALARDAHLVRTPRARTYPARQAAIPPPLHVLLVLSSPLRSGASDDEAVFDLYGEKRALLAELRPLVERGLLLVEVEERPSVERLRSRMARQRHGFHVVHYLGHAQPTGLKLEDPQGRGRLVRAGDFSRLLQELPDLRLAVFAGCETARAPVTTVADRWPGQLSTTDHCVRDASPAVVGMQAVLPFATEKLFTRFFYQSLTAGRSVAEAMRLARLAVAGDDQVGAGLLDWAVPCLVVGGGDPGPLLDPTARATPPPPRRRVSLRLDARQSDLMFFARQAELREAIDVLEGHNRVRLLQVVGGAGVGKSRLLERAVEELNDGVARLSLDAGRLLAAEDPVGTLCGLVEEVLRAGGRRTTARGRRSSAAWWERLLEEVTEVRLAIALDDADGLAEDAARPLREALGALVLRRGEARLAIAAAREITALGGELPASSRRVIRLQPLAWPEVWQWVRRNLPVLTRYGNEALSPYFADLGAYLELWSDLADAVSAGRAVRPEDLPELVRDVARRVSTLPSARSTPPPIFGVGTPAPARPPAPAARPSRPEAPGVAPSPAPLPPTPRRPEPGDQPLRVAIAGPHTDGRTVEFSRALTALAAQFGVGGRMVTADAPDGTSSLGQLLDLRSPFGDGGTASTTDLLRWLADAASARADVVLLDFGSSQPSPVWEDTARSAGEVGRLLVAAGGIAPGPTYPAWLPGVLAVGALEADGTPAPYSHFDPGAGKPEIFAPKTTDASPLAGVPHQEGMEGPSFAALHVVMAAILVWATDRSQVASDVRAALLSTARPGPGGIRILDTGAALEAVRRQILLDALERGPLETGELLAETGMRSELALPLLDALEAEGVLRRVTQEGVERWENPGAVYLVYEELRREVPSSDTRTASLESLVGRIRHLARRGRFDANEIRAMWASDQEGRRIAALAAMRGAPALRELDIALEGISASRTAFEQFHALALAEEMLPHLSRAERLRVRDAVVAQMQAGGWILPGTDRAVVAARLLREVGTEGTPVGDAPGGKEGGNV